MNNIIAEVSLRAHIDAEDIVNGLNSNDEEIIAFVVEIILAAESVEVVDRLRERLAAWWEPDGDGHKEDQ